jgi:hypothetical protein
MIQNLYQAAIVRDLTESRKAQGLIFLVPLHRRRWLAGSLVSRPRAPDQSTNQPTNDHYSHRAQICA